MTRMWACPVCGEPADADELDPHGHFNTAHHHMTADDDATPAELQELSDAVGRADAAYYAAMDRQDAIADEPFETPEQEADIQRRINEMEGELDLLREARDETEREFNNAVSDYGVED